MTPSNTAATVTATVTTMNGSDAEMKDASTSDEEEIIVLKIVSAFYGPCEEDEEGRSGTATGREGTSKTVDPTASAHMTSFTRDVTPILRAVLQQQESCLNATASTNNGDGNVDVILRTDQTTKEGNEEEEEGTGDDDPHLLRLKAISGAAGMKRTSIPISDLKDGCNSMNTIFGDPCPGSSKKLHIHYIIQPSSSKNDNKLHHHLPKKEVHRVSFAEYEAVVLTRRVTFYQDDEELQQATARMLAKKERKDIDNANTTASPDVNVLESVAGEASVELENDGKEDSDEQTLQVARRMGRSDSISEFAVLAATGRNSLSATDKTTTATTKIDSNTNLSILSTGPATPPNKPARLRSATFELVLPMLLPFLRVKERVQCRLVCLVWRNIIRDWGIASIIDSSDPTYWHAFTRPFLRGILSHSYSSLQSLRLSDFRDVAPDDLHPSLPYLRKLRVLDISRCIQLQDETLKMLAQHVSSTLEVLYIKGLVKVSDAGLIAVCQACTKLKVLEVSYIPITDESGVAIGQHLTDLRALYMRDNFRLTNTSIDAITANCTKLNQLTLWGCTKLKYLSFDDNTIQIDSSSNAILGNPREAVDFNNRFSLGGKLVSLNLWGCLKLGDDSALALTIMRNLRSLVVSECHKLTDNFAIGIAQSVPHLVHLHLRYCKRITDAGVDAIANGMQHLYSLDLSFCSKVTVRAVCSLLEWRRESLAELRLRECRQLQITQEPDDFLTGDYDRRGTQQQQQNVPRTGPDGQAILKSLRSPAGYSRIRSSTDNAPVVEESHLSMLDLRCCSGQPDICCPYPDNSAFVRGLAVLGFQQKAPGFFARPAKWNDKMQTRLVDQLDTNRCTNL